MKNKPLPPQILLHELLNYNPHTGVLTWKVRVANAVRIGMEAGTKNSARNGCITISVLRRIYLAHRIVWMHVTGDDPGDLFIDHINGDPSDNRFNNLRIATKKQNNCNAKRPSTNTTGFKGVYWSRKLNKFGACLRVNGKNRSLGMFDSPEDAALAYRKAASERYGEFARFS